MRNFKVVDCWVSITLILYYGLIALPFQIGFTRFILIEGYIVVGTWQSISMMVHSITGYFIHRWNARLIYHLVSLIAVLTIPVGSFWLLLFISPLMAIYYTYMCYDETYVKMKRPMALLK